MAHRLAEARSKTGKVDAKPKHRYSGSVSNISITAEDLGSPSSGSSSMSASVKEKKFKRRTRSSLGGTEDFIKELDFLPPSRNKKGYENTTPKELPKTSPQGHVSGSSSSATVMNCNGTVESPMTEVTPSVNGVSHTHDIQSTEENIQFNEEAMDRSGAVGFLTDEGSLSDLTDVDEGGRPLGRPGGPLEGSAAATASQDGPPESYRNGQVKSGGQECESLVSEDLGSLLSGGEHTPACLDKETKSAELVVSGPSPPKGDTLSSPVIHVVSNAQQREQEKRKKKVNLQKRIEELERKSAGKTGHIRSHSLNLNSPAEIPRVGYHEAEGESRHKLPVRQSTFLVQLDPILLVEAPGQAHPGERSTLISGLGGLSTEDNDGTKEITGRDLTTFTCGKILDSSKLGPVGCLYSSEASESEKDFKIESSVTRIPNLMAEKRVDLSKANPSDGLNARPSCEAYNGNKERQVHSRAGSTVSEQSFRSAESGNVSEEQGQVEVDLGVETTVKREVTSSNEIGPYISEKVMEELPQESESRNGREVGTAHIENGSGVQESELAKDCRSKIIEDEHTEDLYALETSPESSQLVLKSEIGVSVDKQESADAEIVKRHEELEHFHETMKVPEHQEQRGAEMKKEQKCLDDISEKSQNVQIRKPTGLVDSTPAHGEVLVPEAAPIRSPNQATELGSGETGGGVSRKSVLHQRVHPSFEPEQSTLRTLSIHPAIEPYGTKGHRAGLLSKQVSVDPLFVESQQDRLWEMHSQELVIGDGDLRESSAEENDELKQLANLTSKDGDIVAASSGTNGCGQSGRHNRPHTPLRSLLLAEEHIEAKGPPRNPVQRVVSSAPHHSLVSPRGNLFRRLVSGGKSSPTSRLSPSKFSPKNQTSAKPFLSSCICCSPVK